MFFNSKTFQVYRRFLQSGNLGYEWAYIQDIIGTMCPMSVSDAVRNQQDFSDVKNFISMDFSYKGIVKEQDEIVDPDGVRHHVRSVRNLDNVLPHVELFLGKTQWKGEIES